MSRRLSDPGAIRHHGPGSVMPVRAFKSGGRGLAALRAAATPSTPTWNHYEMETKFTWEFWCLWTKFLDIIEKLTEAGFGDLRVQKYEHGRWIRVQLTGIKRKPRYC